MDLFLDFAFAWISIILAILLSVIYLFRKISKKNGAYMVMFSSLNKKLRKCHKFLGITLIITGLIHGLNSSESLFSLNLGTAAWVISVLLGLNYMLRKYLSKVKSWMYYHRILTVAFLCIIILHIIDVGIQAPYLLADVMASNKSSAVTEDSLTNGYSNTTPSSNDLSSDDSTSGNDISGTSDTSISSLNNQMEGVVLKDGVYEGEATGYRDGLVVSVEIENNSIICIEIIDHNEQKSHFYQPAMDQVPAEIIDSQSLDVDTVSGSTFTSVGIINAVKDALSKALISGTLPDDLSLPTRRGHH